MTRDLKIGLSVSAAFVIICVVAALMNPTPENENISQEKSTANEKLLTNSPWDGSVYYAKEYLKKNLNNWDSYESIEWSPAQLTADRSYVVRNKFRAANAFGALVVQDWIFYYTSDGAILNIIGDE